MPPQPENLPDAGAQLDKERLGEANLFFFLNDRLRPVLEQIEVTDSSSVLTKFLEAELLESFLWLHLGVQLEYFPLPPARRAIYEYFPAFLKAYESNASGPFFETWFSPPVRAIWESEFTGRQQLFSSGLTWDHQIISQVTTPIFQNSLILANGFAQNEEARPLVQMIVISKDSDWEEAVEKNHAIPGFEQSGGEKNEVPLHLHWAYPGYFAEVDYLRATRQISAGIRQTLEQTTHEFEDYLRRLKEIQQWRLNFGDTRYRRRFIRIGQMAAETFVKYVPTEETGHSPSVVNRFLAEVYDLITDWGGPQAMAAGR